MPPVNFPSPPLFPSIPQYLGAWPTFGGLCPSGPNVEPRLYSPSPQSGDPIPRSPCSDAYVYDDLIRILLCPVATVRLGRIFFNRFLRA